MKNGIYLKLYKEGPMTSEELSKKIGFNERLLREW